MGVAHGIGFGKEERGIMAGFRKNIYISSVETWESIKSAAKDQGRSVSNYLVNLHQNSLGCQDSAKPAQSERFDSHKPKGAGEVLFEESNPVQKTKESLQTKTNNLLETARALRDQKKSDTFFKPQTKDQQTGKKAKK